MCMFVCVCVCVCACVCVLVVLRPSNVESHCSIFCQRKWPMAKWAHEFSTMAK
jgi:hypothetical protein